MILWRKTSRKVAISGKREGEREDYHCVDCVRSNAEGKGMFSVQI